MTLLEVKKSNKRLVELDFSLMHKLNYLGKYDICYTDYIIIDVANELISK